jgi:hypothetical protein
LNYSEEAAIAIEVVVAIKAVVVVVADDEQAAASSPFTKDAPPLHISAGLT